MSIVHTQIRPGAYYDSVVLMRLQKALVALPGILDAGVVMGTEANKQVLEQSHLLTADARPARPEDLVIAVSAQTAAAAQAALAQVDALLSQRRSAVGDEYRPKSLETALQMLPEAQWVLVSVPGRYAAHVAREALAAGRHVFLYSDNVSLEDELALKQTAREKGLLVMGPDSGSAMINGAGLGFANHVRRGRIGIIGAAGTGIQTVSVALHRLGEGVSHAIGTGTHDLSDAVRAITTLQALDILSRDPQTEVIVLISKPPSPSVAAMVLGAARQTGKPVVVDFIGYVSPIERDGNLYFARTLDEAAEKAVSLVPAVPSVPSGPPGELRQLKELRALRELEFAPGQRYLRGLYSGGTLAYEAQLLLSDDLVIYSNAPLDPAFRLASPTVSQGHTIVDLGADEFMVGRLHPMLDNDLRIRRLRQEADDPEVAVILLDVVLGYGVHPDPTRELAPAISEAKTRAAQAGRSLAVVAFVVGTDEDPQNYTAQVDRLHKAGTLVAANNETAVRLAGALVRDLDTTVSAERRVQPLDLSETTAEESKFTPVPLAALQTPFMAVNIGLEGFFDSLKQQNIPAIQVDWHPPASGNERLMAILAQLKGQQ